MILDILGAFQDPLNLSQGSGKLINVRVVPIDPNEGKKERVRMVGSPGLTQVCKPESSPCLALCHALQTIWGAYASGNIYYGVETGSPVLAGSVDVNPS